VAKKHVLPKYYDLPDGISTIDTGFLRPGFDASNLIVEGQEAAFVDVGTSHAVPVLREVLRQKNISPEDVKYIIVTHIHLDHAGGAGVFLKYLPNARIVVHPRGARHLISPERLVKGSIAVYGEKTFRSYFGDVVPIAQDRVIEATDECRLFLNGRELLFLDTPGHARHHICLVDEKSQGIFTGDTFGLSYREFDTIQGSFIFPATAPVHFDPEKMHETTDLLLSFQPQKMYLTHFGCVTNISKLADDLHERIDHYVALAQNVNRHNNKKRHQALLEAMEKFLCSQIQAHGCHLTKEQIMKVLNPDLMLNVQGLEVWLDRNRKK